MNEVSTLAVRAALRLGESAGSDGDALTAGLAFDVHSLRRLRRVPWDDYCTIVERVCAAAGGLDELEALAERTYHDALVDEVRTVLRALVSPRALYKFTFTVGNPPLFPNVDFEYRELDDGRLLISARIRPYSRGCMAFQRGSVGATRGMTAHLGLPPAELVIDELTERSVVLRARLPDSQTLVARAGRTSSAAIRRAALQLVRHYAAASREQSDSLASLLAQQPRSIDQDLLTRVQRMRHDLALTPRQTEVLALLVRGLSNKEISASLACAENTVELHVTQLLRKAGVQGRAQMIAKFWTGTASH